MDMDKIHDGGNFGLSATLLWSFSDGLPYFWPMLFPFVFVGQINRRSFVEYLKISTAGAAAQQAQQRSRRSRRSRAREGVKLLQPGEGSSEFNAVPMANFPESNPVPIL